MKSIEILNQFKLKRTSCREGIIDIILAANSALSEAEIRKKLAGNYDRSTFYRSFKTLEENKIIHKIVIDNLLVKYAIDCSLSSNKKHAHFFCDKCQTVKCLDAEIKQNFGLPEGYVEQETEVLIKGTCSNCK